MTFTSPSSPQETRLESWKAIAAYLNRDARTVRRWEQAEGLPIHRHHHLARSSVYTYPTELDAWRANRRPEPRPNAPERAWVGPRLGAIAAALALTTLSAGGGRFEGSLAASQAPGQMNRQVWAGADVDTTGTFSDDGRSISYSDLATAEVCVREVESGQVRRFSPKVSPDERGAPYRSALSPDGSRLVVQWQGVNQDHSSIRILDTRSPRSAKVLYESDEVVWIAPQDWSPDGRSVAVQLRRRDRIAQIGLLSVVDGTLQVLKSVTWSGSSSVFFSPDGRRLAYDLPVAEGSLNREIYLLDVNGSREMSAVVHPARDVVMGWAADGSELLMASDRSGRTALYAVPLNGGRPAGPPELIKSDLGRLSVSFGVGRGGGLFYATQTAARTIRIAEVDFETGKLLAPVTEPMETYLWASHEPDWSPDGRLLAFQRETPESRDVLAVRDMTSGSIRHIPLELEGFRNPTWMSNGAIGVFGTDLKARGGLYRVDVSTARVSAILQEPVSGPTFSIAPDGRTVFYRRLENGTTVVRARNLQSGEERTVASASTFMTSPDGRWIAFFEVSRSAGTSVLKVTSLDGADTHVVQTFERGHGLLGMLRWTPDSQRLVYGRWIDARELPTAFSVTVSGGAPVELDAAVPGHPSLAIHPDGHRVAFEAGGTAYEIWALENFLPSNRER